MKKLLISIFIVFCAFVSFGQNGHFNALNVDSLKIIPSIYYADSIVHDGTSITAAASGVSAVDFGFAYVLDHRLNGISSNHGVSGASLFVNMQAHLNTIGNYVANLSRYFVSEWGVNDCNLNVSTTAQFATNYGNYIDSLTINRHWPAGKILMLGLTYIDPTLNVNSTLARQFSFDSVVQVVAAAKGCMYLNLRNSIIAAGYLTFNPADGIHPNNDGCSWMANVIMNKLGFSVPANGQGIASNRMIEASSIKVDLTDTSYSKLTPIGYDSTGKLRPFNRADVVMNSNFLTQAQVGGINMLGTGTFGVITAPYGIFTGGIPSSSYIGLSNSYASNIGKISSNNNGTAEPMELLASQVVINGAPTANIEGFQSPNGNLFNYARITGGLPGGLAGNAMEFGILSSDGYIGVFDRTGSASHNLRLQQLGGKVLFFSGTDNSTGATQITQTTTQMALHYDASHYTQFTVGSTGVLTINPIGITTVLKASTTAGASFNIPSGTAPTSPANGDQWYDGTHYQVRVNGVTRQVDQQTVLSYPHGIFTPTTGGTVSLVNNQYNIINPAGALLALTVNLPSSPANNDVVYIKYTQNITTVTYANGTVVDGITAPTAGGLTVLVFDSGTSSWY